jgi:tetratricopeptide (TPR) repeat protein
MSLLLKALRQAEQSHASHSKAASGNDDGMDELALEPLASALAKPKREWVEPPGQDDDEVTRPGKMHEWRWPLGLVPTTALLALFIAAAYGLYFYWMTQPQSWTAPAPAIASRPIPALPQPETSLPETAPAPASVEDASVHAEAALSKPLAPRVAQTKPASRPTQQTANTTIQPNAPASVLVSTPSPRSNLLEEAYAAFQSGRLDEAQALYQQRANAGHNADALLGLAAVAQARGQTAEAIRLYQAVLEITPRNAIAQAALIDTLGTTDPVAAESRIKNMIARDPSGFLFYALGNLHADQKRWSDAERAYFDAHQLEPGNADYAFNLAVSLDHLKQADAAARYYETALKLAGPATRFDRALAESRVQLLKSR